MGRDRRLATARLTAQFKTRAAPHGDGAGSRPDLSFAVRAIDALPNCNAVCFHQADNSEREPPIEPAMFLR
jgi:hypothetical protein